MLTLKRMTLFFGLLAVLMSSACEKNNPLDSGNQDLDDEVLQEALIESEFAEFTTTNEVPGFGDPALLAKNADDVDAEDAALAEVDVAVALTQRSGAFRSRSVG